MLDGMDTVDASMRLGDLVTAHPELAREFERRGFDYCCGGRQTLADACHRAEFDPADVVGQLRAALVSTPPEDWTTMDARHLVDHIEATHHRFLWDELPRVGALLDRLVVAHRDRHPELDDIVSCFAEIRADLEPHLRNEEETLFPMVRSTTAAADHAVGTLRNALGTMLAEHDRVGELLAGLRFLTADYAVPADTCATYAATMAALAGLEADTHLHIHKENNVLFPMLVRLEAEVATARAQVA
jgi:regulator of cell morphogenesis and NO signaling